MGRSSKYAKYGWVNGLDPTSYVGMQITYNRSDDSDADFNTTRVGVSGKLNVHNLDVWGEKIPRGAYQLRRTENGRV